MSAAVAVAGAWPVPALPRSLRLAGRAADGPVRPRRHRSPRFARPHPGAGPRWPRPGWRCRPRSPPRGTRRMAPRRKPVDIACKGLRVGPIDGHHHLVQRRRCSSPRKRSEMPQRVSFGRTGPYTSPSGPAADAAGGSGFRRRHGRDRLTPDEPAPPAPARLPRVGRRRRPERTPGPRQRPADPAGPCTRGATGPGASPRRAGGK